MLSRLRESVTGALCHLEIQTGPSSPEDLMPEDRPGDWNETREEPAMAEVGAGGGAPSQPAMARRAAAVDASNPDTWGKVPRNALCPCGSGKKYKQCHGRLV